MDLIIAQLDRKYSNFSEALKKENFFCDSYKYIYEYLDIIDNQPDIQKIIKQDRQEFEDKKETVSTDKNISEKDKKKTIDRIKDYSFSFCYDTLHEKVYVPMKEYRESPVPLSEKLSVGRALSLPEEYIGTLFYLICIYFSWIIDHKESKKFFHSRIKYKWWLKDFAVAYLGRLHATLVKKIVEINNLAERKNIKPEIFSFNGETGQFTYYKTKNILSPTSNEFKLFKALYNAPNFQLGYNELIKSYKPEITIASKTDKMDISDIVRNIKNKFLILPLENSINPDIFENIKKTGYQLNIPTPE